MGLPAKKRSKQQKRERRGNIFLKARTLTRCPKCKTPVKPHHVCSNCGYYKGRDVLHLEAKAEHKKKRQKKHEKKTTS